MGRPATANRLATVQFNARLTVGQMNAIQDLARKWADDMRAKGLPLLGDNMTAWFRWVIQKEAAEQGIAITEPSVQVSAEPPASAVLAAPSPPTGQSRKAPPPRRS